MMSQPLSLYVPTAHAKEALDLARMQEQTEQLKQQEQIRVGAYFPHKAHEYSLQCVCRMQCDIVLKLSFSWS